MSCPAVTLQPLPTPLPQGVMANIGHNEVLFVPQDSNYFQCTFVLTIDPTTCTMEYVAIDCDLDIIRYYPTLTRIGSEVLMYGGYVSYTPDHPMSSAHYTLQQECMSDLFIFDIPTRVWREVPKRGVWPRGLQLHTAYERRGCLVVLGGSTDTLGIPGSQSVWEYNLETQEWRRCPQLPADMYMGVCTRVRGVSEVCAFSCSDRKGSPVYNASCTSQHESDRSFLLETTLPIPSPTVIATLGVGAHIVTILEDVPWYGDSTVRVYAYDTVSREWEDRGCLDILGRADNTAWCECSAGCSVWRFNDEYTYLVFTDTVDTFE
ncbi:hypothetical protein KIPB_013670 [Kipferlia bialata]|uniref:Uncharacterized protein n=1 Tax=Kipferlia bialata TaxID=797122 RepID=A0A9K3D9L9_9EUKA|nr:hypothetical protein KIPB_013670 [Kipferlia bialata]|eukprot:g13670.t1